MKIQSIVYDMSTPNNIEVLKDIPYLTTTAFKMTMDIYKPLNMEKGYLYPVVVFIHGGSNEKRDYKSYECFSSWAELVSMNAMIGITFNWRKNIPSDIEDFLNYLIDNSGKYQIDIARIITFSFSRGVQAGIHYSLKLPNISRMVVYYGKIPTEDLMKSEKKCKFFIAMGQNDHYYNSHCNNGFIQKARQLENTVEFFIHSNGEHGFDFLNDDDESKKIIERTLNFLKQ